MRAYRKGILLDDLGEELVERGLIAYSYSTLEFVVGAFDHESHLSAFHRDGYVNLSGLRWRLLYLGTKPEKLHQGSDSARSFSLQRA